MIKQSRPFLQKADFDYIKDILKTAQIAQGNFVEKLQNEFCKVIDTQYACAVSSGTAALHLALLALDIGRGDEVILPSYTCTAVLNAVNYVFATPVVIDVDPWTFNITNATIKNNITKKTKAIILTHTFGFPADMDGILKLVIPVIEDCAHALGATYKERQVGSLGAISIFSMYATKMLTAGEGGMICTNNKKLAETVMDLNNPDMRESYRVRYNYKMSDLTAGLALNQLKKLNFFVMRRRLIAAQYKKAFFSLPIKFQQPLPDSNPNYYRFIICSSRASKVIDFAKRYGVICDKPVAKPLHRYLNIKDEDFIGTNYLWNNGMSVPLYPSLFNKEMYRVVEIVKKAFMN